MSPLISQTSLNDYQGDRSQDKSKDTKQLYPRIHGYYGKNGLYPDSVAYYFALHDLAEDLTDDVNTQKHGSMEKLAIHHL